MCSSSRLSLQWRCLFFFSRANRGRQELFSETLSPSFGGPSVLEQSRRHPTVRVLHLQNLRLCSYPPEGFLPFLSFFFFKWVGGIPSFRVNEGKSNPLKKKSLPLWGGYNRDSWGERATSASSSSTLLFFFFFLVWFSSLRWCYLEQEQPRKKALGIKAIWQFFRCQKGIIAWGELFSCLCSYIVLPCERQEAHDLRLSDQSLSKCARQKKKKDSAPQTRMG